jgi:hypothetical protein
MTNVPSIADLVRQIEAHDASATAAIAALEDRCLVVDGRNRTLFDVAILADNTEVIELLAADPNAQGFAAPVDAKLEEPIKHAVAMYAVEAPISKLETYLEDGFGKNLAYGRTPLHTACRAGNANAIETLLAAGAKTVDKDAIGLTAPELAFFAHGDAGLRDFLAAFERSGQTKFAVGKRLLAVTLAFPDTMSRLLRVARLDAAAQRLLFCYRCAWLDVDAVRAMLAEGQNPNKGVTAELNPLWEACTSAMLWDAAIPGGLEMAFHFTRYAGHPDASAVSFDNALLNEDGSNFGKLFAEAERKRKALALSVEAMTLAADAERQVIERRIALLDVLLDAGADIGLARKKLNSFTFDDLKLMKLGEVERHLKQRGGGAPPKKKRKPAAATQWELVGETGLNAEYWPDEGSGGCVRLVLHDSYGPVDGVTLSVRLSRGKAKPSGQWRQLKPVTETLDVEGEPVPRAELVEPVYGETPWEAVYELSLEKANGAKVLWVRLDHPQEERLRGELDPWKFARG